MTEWRVYVGIRPQKVRECKVISNSVSGYRVGNKQPNRKVHGTCNGKLGV